MPKQINFFKGHPTLDLLPKKELSETFTKVISETAHTDYESDPHNRHPLQYGTDLGNLTARESVARWVNGQFGRNSLHADQINLTGGSSYGSQNILLATTNVETTVQAFVVSPTYFLINYAFIDAGFEGKMTAVKETPGQEFDIDLDFLEKKLKELDEKHGLEPVGDKEINVFTDPTGRDARKQYRYVMYLVPSFSNPGGLTYTEATRIRLLKLARKHDLLLLSDDVYDHLNYDGKPPVRKFNQIDEDTLPKGWKFGNSVSNSSFSKILAPGLRVGWQETATPALALQLSSTGANKSGGSPGQLNSVVVQHLITDGTIDKIVEFYKKTYKARAETLKKALDEHLPPKYTKHYGGDGGYFVWVTIDAPNFNLSEVISTLQKEHNVIIADGGNFEVEGDSLGWAKLGARLCVALLTEEEIEEGIKKWGQVLHKKHPELY
ncbi:hypothetical protein FT663_03842 [Candidozyma haemuli var. vulneris]|uniref:Aminotransferase class I/classII large domain-containing protein n=1 Tax=Candidozyma haemuli TaxID=45357 RepID=A0A2V1AYP2_9ASCO|nr:hypothetical protein CXQ85_002649 [[Candida] haemuloni]KAF3988754.1 hypothetical protein FT662_03204 [[Candida] haemuloni var. vulneris]KAF3988869.1 hypothetical protein FT663_03842 [[Candida] haemuloni var. vulneris]PVH22924.1 hypothetical protein CXQ85_002649 [[Candida] haemuloni]